MDYIIFDLDGTLIDSMPVWKDTGKKFLLKHNYPVPDDLHEVVKTQTMFQTAEYFRTKLGVTHSVEEICSEIISYVDHAYRHTIPLKPFAGAFLEKEYKKGSKMCILSASEADYIMPAIERLGIMKYFQFIMTCSEAGLFKSDPEVFNIAMKRLGGTVERTCVFEDALYAVEGAKKGGFTVYAVADPVTETDSTKIRNTADRFVTSYKELL